MIIKYVCKNEECGHELVVEKNVQGEMREVIFCTHCDDIMKLQIEGVDQSLTPTYKMVPAILILAKK